jgi:electron transport complex protein RnfG
LKSVIKIIRTAGLLLAFSAVTLAAPPVHAEVEYFSTRAVLASFFPKSERVTYRTLALEGATGTRVAQRLGYKPALDRYTVFVALTQGHVDGYAVIDNEKGLHEPITFATKLTPQGIVEKVEIMVYREPRGDEVRDPRFRKQFEGRSARDELRISHDLDAVSGATISSHSLAVGVRRATVLVDELISTTSKSIRTESSNAPASITTASR